MTIEAAPAPKKVLPEPKPLAETESERVYQEIDGILTGLFMAAQDPDDEVGFEAFLQLVHSDRTDAPRSIPSLKEFTFKSLRKKLAQYIGKDGAPTAFAIARRVLECPGRSPVPISFRRDPEHGDAWRMLDSSL